MKIRHLFLLVGVVLFYFVLRHIGLATIAHHVEQLGWWLIPAMAMAPCWYACYAAAWRQILRSHQPIGLWSIFRIKIVGEAINTLTPANFIGGDPMRVYLLRRYFPWMQGTASVVIDRTLHTMATFTLVIIAAVIAFIHIPHVPRSAQYGIPLILVLVSTGVAFFLVHSHRGIVHFLIRQAKRLRLKRNFSDKTLARVEELDELIAKFYQRHPGGFWSAFGLHFLGRCIGVLEIYLIGHILSPQFGGIEAVILTGLAPLVNMLFTFIPGAMGIMEGAYGGVLYLLGFDPALGLTIQIIKRLRAGLWIAIGFIFLSTHDRKKIWEPARS